MKRLKIEKRPGATYCVQWAVFLSLFTVSVYSFETDECQGKDKPDEDSGKAECFTATDGDTDLTHTAVRSKISVTIIKGGTMLTPIVRLNGRTPLIGLEEAKPSQDGEGAVNYVGLALRSASSKSK